jgi:hypothetical protein
MLELNINIFVDDFDEIKKGFDDGCAFDIANITSGNKKIELYVDDYVVQAYYNIDNETVDCISVTYEFLKIENTEDLCQFLCEGMLDYLQTFHKYCTNS